MAQRERGAAGAPTAPDAAAPHNPVLTTQQRTAYFDAIEPIRCKRCKRPLSASYSITRRHGAVCWRRRFCRRAAVV